MLKTLGEDLDSISLEGALGRSKARNPVINTVIDVGASDGRWTNICRQYFPEAYYFLIEAQEPHRPALQALKDRTPNLDYLLSAAGDTEGQIYFDATDLLGGIASHTPVLKNCITVPVTTIDAQVRLRNLKPPYLIKLDTHGFEIPILTGAIQSLGQTAIIIVETYNFNFSTENLRFHQITSHLETLGFRPADLFDPGHRPLDGALWQFDLLFEPTASPTFQTTEYYR